MHSLHPRALRNRKKRHVFRHSIGLGHKKVNRYWSDEETASLLLHYELFGPKWMLIGRSLQRTPDSIRGRLVRMGCVSDRDAAQVV